MCIIQNTSFTDPLAMWTDFNENNIYTTGTVTNISGTVIASTIGTYLLDYRYYDGTST